MEDCSHYGRVHHLFTELLAPSNWRINAAVETNMKYYDPTSAGDSTGTVAIDAGEYATVLFTPSALGIMHCGKLWPIEMAPLSLEIAFAPPSDAVVSAAGDHPANRASSSYEVVEHFGGFLKCVCVCRGVA